MTRSEKCTLATPKTRWRRSSFSGDQGNCVEVAWLADGRVGVRDSKNPGGGMLVLTAAQMHAWIDGIRAGEFDHAR